MRQRAQTLDFSLALELHLTSHLHPPPPIFSCPVHGPVFCFVFFMIFFAHAPSSGG